MIEFDAENKDESMLEGGSRMKRVKAIIGIIVVIMLLIIPTTKFACSESISQNKLNMSFEENNRIEEFIKGQMNEGKIPGLSVVIVSGNETAYSKCFGYSDLESKKPVTSNTLFEIGSNSKAFTALGVLLLEENNKIGLDEPVSKYIPWLKFKYMGKEVNVTLDNLIHQTSGIPYNTIGNVQALKGQDALEQTIRALANIELDYYPGERFSYSDLNYDVLGLVIQIVTGQSFELYMKDNVLNNLGLDNTYLFREEARLNELATGYKINFLRNVRYEAPVFRGNTPASSFISSSFDIEKWLKIQIGADTSSSVSFGTIKKSQTPDRTVNPYIDGSSYAKGWRVYQNGKGELAHEGNNPNYSSYIVFRPEEKLGVAVLTNTNSNYTQIIGQGIINILRGKNYNANGSDLLLSIDNISFVLIILLSCLSLIIICLLIKLIIDILKKERKLMRFSFKKLISFFAIALFISCLGYCLYNLPKVLFGGLNWEYVIVWSPYSMIIAVALIFTTSLLFCLYYAASMWFIKSKEKNYFTMMVLSVTSGLGNALIIFLINKALVSSDKAKVELLVYFAMSIIIYVLCQKLVREKLITITNDIVYSKRMELIEKISNTSVENFESFENGQIHAVLNNDTEMISNFANIVITGVTSIITLLCCFVYLGIINIYALLTSIIVMFIAAGLYFYVGRSANKVWEKTRDIQNIFFKYVNDLINGFKELRINSVKKAEFNKDVDSSCYEYREKRIQGDLKFTYVFVVGELIFTMVIGSVVFVFPLVFKEVNSVSLINYVFVFLYMQAPVYAILNAIPNFVKLKISWNRIKEFNDRLSGIENKKIEKSYEYSAKNVDYIELKEVEYKYHNEKGNPFSVGPLDLRFNKGEIAFITGGNGSGKSTLAKLLTGLYKPQNGSIVVNGREVHDDELGELYSTIFSDFHLFDKLYGVNYSNKKEESDKYLEELKISDKLEINDGVFSTIKLSTGQRKRLALLVSYLEDKQIMLFDEWAADQDPEFRKFFYNELLPGFKRKGKCIIAITHDDRYFDVADKVIKMDMGMVVNE